jgi:hypothetical protein
MEVFAPKAESLTSFAAQTEQNTIKTFFDGYVVVSADRAVSSGFLDALHVLSQGTSESSHLAQAMTIIALAGAANTTGNMDLLRGTRLVYGQLLGSLRHTFSTLLEQSSMELLATIVLLGIYEVRQRDGRSSRS